jgi:magnesium transporter
MGVTSLREVMLAPPEQKLSEFMYKHIITADVMEDQRDVAQKIAEYNLLALPVVEHDKMVRASLPSLTAMDIILPRPGRNYPKGVW